MRMRAISPKAEAVPTKRVGIQRPAFAAVFLLSGIGLAVAETKPESHPLPLHDGFYLDADVPCGEAYTAAMVQIMGERFEAGRNLCTIRSVARQGTSFAVTDQCQDTSTGKTHAGKITFVIPDAHTFMIGAKDDQQRFRYCPIPSLPQPFAHAKETVPDTPPFE
jgi:hypothetical protein